MIHQRTRSQRGGENTVDNVKPRRFSRADRLVIVFVVVSKEGTQWNGDERFVTILPSGFLVIDGRERIGETFRFSHLKTLRRISAARAADGSVTAISKCSFRLDFVHTHKMRKTRSRKRLRDETVRTHVRPPSLPFLCASLFKTLRDVDFQSQVTLVASGTRRTLLDARRVAES